MFMLNVSKNTGPHFSDQKMARKYSKTQLYRFPILMGGILGGIMTFLFTFSSVNSERIKWGSKRFTDAPKVTFQDDK